MGVGQREKATQKRVIKLFVQELGSTYLGDFTERENSNIETELLTKFLSRKGYSPVLISRALKELRDAHTSRLMARLMIIMIVAQMYQIKTLRQWAEQRMSLVQQRTAQKETSE